MGLAAGGLSFAAMPGGTTAAIIGVGLGAVVYGTKVGASALVGRTQGSESSTQLEGPRPKRGSAAEVWVGRSEKAMRTMNSLIEGATDSLMKGQLDSVGVQASGTLETIARLSHQVAAVEVGLDRIPLSRLTDQQARLQAEASRGLIDESSIETSKSLHSVNEQLDSFDRLRTAREALLSRMESATLGLESINSHIVELIAMSATSVTVEDLGGDGVIGSLNQELADIRAGLAESEAYTREVLRGDTA